MRLSPGTCLREGASPANFEIADELHKALRLWAAQTSYQLPLPPGARCSHAAPAFSSDNRWLAVANARNDADVFDIATEKLICELPPFDEAITHLSFATEAAWLLAASERQIAVWNVL